MVDYFTILAFTYDPFNGVEATIYTWYDKTII